MLIFRVQIAAEIRDEDQENRWPPECAFVQHKENGQQRSGKRNKNLAVDKVFF